MPGHGSLSEKTSSQITQHRMHMLSVWPEPVDSPHVLATKTIQPFVAYQVDLGRKDVPVEELVELPKGMVGGDGLIRVTALGSDWLEVVARPPIAEAELPRRNRLLQRSLRILEDGTERM